MRHLVGGGKNIFFLFWLKGLIKYKFKVKWVAGKRHSIADALSRTPVFLPADLTEDLAICMAVSVLDPSMEIITDNIEEE